MSVNICAVALFRHAHKSECGKTYCFNVVIDIGKTGDELIVLLKYFNQYDLTFPDGSYFFIHANIVKMVDSVDLHYTATIPEVDRLAASDFDMMGDILFPLPSQVVLPYGPIIYASGVVSDVDKEHSQFNVNVEHYITFIHDMNTINIDVLKKSAGNNTLIPPHLHNHTASISLKAVILDSPRWKNCDKPMPANGRHVSIHASLARVKREKVQSDVGLELEVAKEFVVNLELIAFLGNAPTKASASSATESQASGDSIVEAPASARKRLKFTGKPRPSAGESSPLSTATTKSKCKAGSTIADVGEL
ncbi:hypothetical protein BKA93DRAFT_824649 [Sparassis latifolia]